jgi:cell division protein FtsB
LGLFVFVLGIITLVNTSKMTERAKALSAQRTQVETAQKENAELALQLEEASDGAKICYAAARNLGMVSAQGADVVYLVAPSTRMQKDQEKAAVPQARAGIYAALFGFLD